MVKLGVDINDLANKVYRHNFPEDRVENKNIKGLSEKFIHKLDVNAILMSPPCQPFTRNGKFLDLADHRTDPFELICDLIPKLPEIEFILMENVMGFEKSQARERYTKVLKGSGYFFTEFLLSPSSLGVPNTRFRYYCIATRNPSKSSSEIVSFFLFEATFYLLYLFQLAQIPNYGDNPEIGKIEAFLESPRSYSNEDFLLSDKLLTTRYKVLDVVVPSSQNSMCFTKAYTHYLEGTGSVFSPTDEETVRRCFKPVLESEIEPLEGLRELKLRFFSPKEVARLMKFPENFSFPKDVTNRQRYRLLGNSINVAVVGELIRFMVAS